MQKILKVKEENYHLLEKLLDKYEAIVVLNLNIPTSIELDRIIIKNLYNEAITLLISNFDFDYILIDNDKNIRFFCIKNCQNFLTLKKRLMELEEMKSKYRIYDFDLYIKKANCVKNIGRKDLKINFRKCFICENNSIICRRENLHTKEELRNKIFELINDKSDENILDDFSSKIASLGVAASIYETLIYPKPGLVDPIDSGIHNDMNIFTFARSSSILWPYLYKCSLIGSKWNDKLKKLYYYLKPVGIDCEINMNKITGGINTHKGLIFIFGFIAASRGYLFGKNIKYSLAVLLDTISEMGTELISEEMENKIKLSTKGDLVYKKFKISGIRGEVEKGLPIAREIYEKLFTKKISDIDINDAGLKSLFEIFTKIEDTNIIYKNKNYMENIREISKNILENWKDKSNFQDIQKYFKQKKISPGGSGDLLATIFYFYLLDNY